MVTAVVPVYNVAEYLRPCLDSLLAQTMDDFEVVIVDDGSTDGSGDIANEYATMHGDRFRVIVRPNGGLGDARNAGIAASRGRYLAFVDGDDLVAPEMLARMSERALETGADMVVCGIESFMDDVVISSLPEPDMSVFGHALSAEPRLLYRVDASACDKLVERSLVERSGVLFPVGVAFEDLPTVYRWLAYSRRVEKVDEPLYRYRQRRAGSITAGDESAFMELIAALDDLDGFYQGLPDAEKYRDALLRLNLVHLLAGRYPDLFLRAGREVRSTFAEGTFALLDARFPGWRGSQVAAVLWPHPLLRTISTHMSALRLFCSLPSRWYLAALARLGGFDPLR